MSFLRFHIWKVREKSMYIQKYSQRFSNIRIFVTVNIELCRGKHIQQAHCLILILVFFFSFYLQLAVRPTTILTTFLYVATFGVASPKSPSPTATITRLGNTCQLANITCIKDSYRPGYSTRMLTQFRLQHTVLVW